MEVEEEYSDEFVDDGAGELRATGPLGVAEEEAYSDQFESIFEDDGEVGQQKQEHGCSELQADGDDSGLSSPSRLARPASASGDCRDQRQQASIVSKSSPSVSSRKVLTTRQRSRPSNKVEQCINRSAAEGDKHTLLEGQGSSGWGGDLDRVERQHIDRGRHVHTSQHPQHREQACEDVECSVRTTTTPGLCAEQIPRSLPLSVSMYSESKVVSAWESTQASVAEKRLVQQLLRGGLVRFQEEHASAPKREALTGGFSGYFMSDNKAPGSVSGKKTEPSTLRGVLATRWGKLRSIFPPEGDHVFVTFLRHGKFDVSSVSRAQRKNALKKSLGHLHKSMLDIYARRIDQRDKNVSWLRGIAASVVAKSGRPQTRTGGSDSHAGSSGLADFLCQFASQKIGAPAVAAAWLWNFITLLDKYVLDCPCAAAFVKACMLRWQDVDGTVSTPLEEATSEDLLLNFIHQQAHTLAGRVTSRVERPSPCASSPRSQSRACNVVPVSDQRKLVHESFWDRNEKSILALQKRRAKETSDGYEDNFFSNSNGATQKLAQSFQFPKSSRFEKQAITPGPGHYDWGGNLESSKYAGVSERFRSSFGLEERFQKTVTCTGRLSEVQCVSLASQESDSKASLKVAHKCDFRKGAPANCNTDEKARTSGKSSRGLQFKTTAPVRQHIPKLRLNELVSSSEEN